jgi:hypothetical protein
MKHLLKQSKQFLKHVLKHILIFIIVNRGIIFDVLTKIHNPQT